MLQSLSIENFKSLRKVDVNLRRLVVVFGPNAAGKSNLLEALVLLSRLVSERTLAEAFDEGLRGRPNEAFSFGPGGIEEFNSRDEAKLRLEACVGDQQEKRLRYGVEVGIRPKTGELFLVDEVLQPLTSKGKNSGKPVIGRSDDETKLRVRRRNKQAHPFEENPGLHHTLVSNLQFSGEGYPNFDELRKDVGTWRAVYLDPREAMRRAEPPREVADIGDRGQWLVPFIHRLQESADYQADLRAIVRATRIVIPSIEDVRTELVKTRGEVELQLKQDGTWMSARVVSEGTLRVLALCAMAANPFSNGLIAFEEPENGVHPRRIENVTAILVAAARAPRQVVVTTHSPLVVGEIVRRVRHGEIAAEDVSLLAASFGPDGTEFQTFEPNGPLFDDQEIGDALQSGDDASRVEAMLRRGWLDG